MAEEKKRPEQTIRDGEVSVTVWKNTNKEGQDYLNYGIQVRYKDGEEWKTGSSYSKTQLNKLRQCINAALLQSVVVQSGDEKKE